MSDDLLKMLDDGIMPQSCDDCAIDSAIYVACGRGSCLAETRLHHKIAEHTRAQAARIAELEALMQEFVDRCERGEILSRRTYGKFKEALRAAEKEVGT